MPKIVQTLDNRFQQPMKTAAPVRGLSTFPGVDAKHGNPALMWSSDSMKTSQHKARRERRRRRGEH